MATTSSPSSSPKRLSLDIQELLKPISGDSPSGVSLKYELIYDEIRHARQEDDPRLSRGIWITDLKKADWKKIENLCSEALKNQTKDIQICVWLAEAWTCLEGLEGYNQGIMVISKLSSTFWTTLHPLPLEDGDMENRYNIFDWADTTLSNRLLMIPLTQSKLDQSSFGLGYYKSAQHGDAALRRVEQSRVNPIDPIKSVGILEDFQKSMEQTSDAFLYAQQSQIQKAIEATSQLKETLSTLFSSNPPAFLKTSGTLREMERILKATLQTRAPAPQEQPAPSNENPEESADNFTPTIATKSEEVGTQSVDEEQSIPNPLSHANILRTREDAYRQLTIIANFLEENEPQSLAPQLLRQLISWEHKNIVEVLSQIAKTPEEYEILLKILGNPTLTEP